MPNDPTTAAPPASLPSAFVEACSRALPPRRFSTDPADCLPYGSDNSRRTMLPQAIAIPDTAEEVQAIVKACAEHRIPLTTRGRATNTVGGTVPVKHGLVLSLERMNRLIRMAPDDRYAEVEPGMLNAELQSIAGEHGFFWPPDPTSAAYCSIGGNLGCNASGPRAVKYGTCRENTLGITAVDGQGRLLKTGVYTTKGVVGYDLTRLLVGSEGTLGIITSAVLKLTPVPASKATVRAIYDSIEGSARAIARVMAQPETPCALEFIDRNAIAAIRAGARGTQVDLPANAAAMLMIEVDGSRESLSSAISAVSDAASGDGLVELRQATDAGEIAALWATRKALSPALRHIASKKINEDVVVPVSRLPELIAGLDALAEKHQVHIVNFGHAGNGNMHTNLLGEPEDMERMHRCLDDVFDLVLSLDGTLSGEHGVGIEKRPFIDREIPAASLDVMAELKRVFDPHGILNPGKLLPDRI
ncbi:MAG: FAD-binding oxidoreductase [Xanthomonadales bacterium]|jgi:D-lactate dehydrogenase|nr:FAD-binding oxidoreductase [Xanthomonadales bacterium]